VPQPTAPPRAPTQDSYILKILNFYLNVLLYYHHTLIAATAKQMNSFIIYISIISFKPLQEQEISRGKILLAKLTVHNYFQNSFPRVHSLHQINPDHALI
jgi:hypothetical protein